MATQPEFYSDLDYTPSINNLGDISKVVNAESVKQSIRTIVLTSKGSRIFEPDFGCGIEGYLFQPFDNETAQLIGNEIERAITNYETRVIIQGLTVKTIEASQTYEISISYLIKDVQEADSFVVKFVKI
jgi:phage baseplate assembly protein W